MSGTAIKPIATTQAIDRCMKDSDMEIDKAELKAFIASRRKLGWIRHQLRRHKDGVTWWGGKAEMRAVVEAWTEALWLGWQLRAAVDARIPLTNEGVLTVVQALPGGAAGFGDQWRRTAGAIGTNLDALPKN